MDFGQTLDLFGLQKRGIVCGRDVNLSGYEQYTHVWFSHTDVLHQLVCDVLAVG
jgi:hypothetical protein